MTTSTTVSLPQVDGSVLADLLDALPTRLRKRLDSMTEKAAGWPLEQVDDTSLAARVDGETTVTVRVRNGVLHSADDVHCDCLLAPACLHRSALIALAPPLDPDAQADTGSAAAEGAAPERTAADTVEPVAVAGPSSAEDVSGAEPSALTAAERSAARSLWDAGSALLLGGVIGASLFNEAQLRRVAHQARALGLYRAAALGNQIAAGLRAARERRDDYSLPQLTADLRELLLVARALPRVTGADEPADLRGIARRGYDHLGSLRLYGLFSEPIIARSGHAGVVTHLVDDSGVLWTTANVMPGDSTRVRPAYNTAVGLGGTVLSHRELARAGLMVSGASASADGRLSGGGSARAVKATGVQWTEPPIAALFKAPLEQQVERAFAVVGPGSESGGRVGADLVFAAVRVLGPTEHGFAAATPAGEPVYCVPAQVGFGLPYQRNLEALSRPGLCLRIIARLDPHRPATLRVLAASPDAEWTDEQPPQDHPDPAPQDGPDLALPSDWAGRINLGLDSVSPAAGAGSASGSSAPEPDAPPLADGTTLHLLRHRLEQAVAGGRVVTATACADRDAGRLRQSALHTAADLLTGLALAAPSRRDAFGRPLPDDGYVEAWLAAAHYEAVASQRLLLRRWLRA
jgi:hypothetical protein